MHFLFIDYENLVIMLSIVLGFFAILLILGIRKSYMLKKENEKLDKLSEKLAKENENTYEDFTDGHMYQ